MDSHGKPLACSPSARRIIRAQTHRGSRSPRATTSGAGNVDEIHRQGLEPENRTDEINQTRRTTKRLPPTRIAPPSSTLGRSKPRTVPAGETSTDCMNPSRPILDHRKSSQSRRDKRSTHRAGKKLQETLTPATRTRPLKPVAKQQPEHSGCNTAAVTRLRWRKETSPLPSSEHPRAPSARRSVSSIHNVGLTISRSEKSRRPVP